ncbi:MAG: putative acyl-CoA synthetase [Caulobacteraceae bacterium]|nr:putative acyl-CoA synthetase [Caulobacteraceae bacterium]
MRSLPDLLAKRADISPEATAFRSNAIGQRVSYRALDAAAGRAAALMRRAGVQAGDRVAVLCRNRVEFFEILFGCARIGAILAPLNWRMPAEELGPLLDLTKPRLILFGREDREAAEAVAGGIRAIGLDDPGPQGYAALGATAEPLADRRDWPVDEVWYLLFTSGTTGRPKAVINTYGMAMVNAVNIGSGIGLTAADRTVSFLPLFHAGGIGLHVLPTLFAGGEVTMLPGFDADALIGLIRAKQLDTVFAVPAIYLQLSLHPQFDSLDLSGVRHWGCGGAPLADALLARFVERGAVVCNGMGMTETGPTMFLMDRARVLDKVGSVGKPQMLAQARVVGPDGRDVPRGAVGELWFAGPGITPGYWADPGATAAAFSACGWLKSGDLGRQDEDGYFFVVGRFKEMFISGGENVYPAEAENVLTGHPQITDAAVIGVADERWGEVGRAYVTLRHGSAPSCADLESWCRLRLAAYKVPKTFLFVTDLPRNALGKVLKHRLAELDLQ